MPAFLYYIPGHQAATPKLLGTLGLSYAFSGGVYARGCERGPDQGRGCIVADKERVQEPGYWPDKQTWRRIPGRTTWVGYFNDQSPEPPDLLLPRPIGGAKLKLDDGREWLCPVARAWMRNDGEFAWANNIPHQMTLGEDGNWQRSGIKPRYAELWNIAEAWHRIRWGGGSPADEARFRGGAEAAAAVVCLQANYAVGPAEVSMLGVLEDEAILTILDTLIDRATLMRFMTEDEQKKTRDLATPGGSSALPGPADETPTTAQPSLT